jgi:hypothetical protein
MRARGWFSKQSRVVALVFIFLSIYLCSGGSLFKRLHPPVDVIANQANPNTQTTNAVGIDNILVFIPTAAKLASFNATAADDGVLFSWRTGFEASNLGFNIYREEAGRRTRINPEMIAGSALMTGASLMAGRSYAWLDRSQGGDGAQYWLEEVDLNGERVWHGPIAAERSERPAAAKEQSLMLSRVGAKEPSATPPSSAAVERAAPAPKPTVVGLSLQAAATARSSVKLLVEQEGWYRVTQPELVRAGLDPSTDPRSLQLLVDGQQQAISVNGEADGRFDATDSIEFYGLGVVSPVTDARAYWVAAGDSTGKRIVDVKGRKAKNTATSYACTVERRDRTVYFSSLRNKDVENFFGPVLAKEPVTQSLALRDIDRAARTDALLEVFLQGVTPSGHKVRLFLNGSDLGEINFYDRAQGSARWSVPVAELREGDNAVVLVAQGGEGDVSLIDRVRLTYQRVYRAENDSLRFTARAKSRLTVDGFTGDQIRVLDVTDPNGVTAVKAQAVQQAGGYGVTFIVPGSGERSLLALTGAGYKQAAAIKSYHPSDLRQPDRAADLVIVSHHDFLEAVAPLEAFRESQGLTVAVVDVEDIYNEYSYGQKTPQALKDFFSYAASSWRRAPRFVLLVGDASLDPKNYLGQGDFDFLPTKMVDTLAMETASDDWLTDFDGDELANIAMGRLPVRTPQEANVVVGKIISYDGAGPSDGVLLVTDTDADYNFRAINPQVKALIPDRLRVQEIERGGAGQAAKSELLESLNRGPKIVNYYGHGTVDQWNGDFLDTSDAPGLTNRDSLTLFFSVTCLNGYFQDPATKSLAESLLMAEQGGAAAVWASSGICDAASQAVINVEMFRLLFASPGSDHLTLGEAALRAKSVVPALDTRRTYILFGDPTTRLK